MNGTIEFDFETHDGRVLEILGEVINSKVSFKAFNNKKKVTKDSLTTFDIGLIEETILENFEEDVNFESDFYDRQS